MTIFNIEKYGDFDMPYTALIMIAPDGMSKKDARKIAKEATDLMKNTDDEQKVIKHLRDLGCKTVNYHTIRIGGNL